LRSTVTAGNRPPHNTAIRGDNRRNHVSDRHRSIPSRVFERFDLLVFRQDVPARLPEPPPLVDAAQPVVQRAIRRFLEFDVERGLDRQPVFIQRFCAVSALEFLPDFLDEVRRDRIRGIGGGARSGTRGGGIGFLCVM
jgi:hypothetical protein